MKIGIYDSGIGGLSVLHRALKKMPEAEFIYYADTKHVPYGEKTREQIQELIEMVGEMTEEQFRWFTDQVQRELFYKDDQSSHREDLK